MSAVNGCSFTGGGGSYGWKYPRCEHSSIGIEIMMMEVDGLECGPGDRMTDRVFCLFG